MSQHSFLCKCNETYYAGDRCQFGIVRLPSFPRLEVGHKSSLLTIEAKVKTKLIIFPVLSNSKLIIQPQTAEITYPLTKWQFRIDPKALGYVEISYVLSGPDKDFFKKPENSILYIIDSMKQSNLSFIPNTPMTSGQCYETLLSTCHSGSKLKMASSCPWMTNATNGYQSVIGGELRLPFSISGLNLTKNSDFQRIGVLTAYEETIDMLKVGMKPCREDKLCMTNASTRYDKHEHKYLIEFDLFMRSYIEEVSHATPWWFHMDLPYEYSGFHKNNIQSVLIKGEAANKISLCPKLKTKPGSIYSVLSPHTTFRVHLLGKTVSVLNEHSTCVAADVCNNTIFASFGDSKAINLDSDLKSIGIQYTKVDIRAFGITSLNRASRVHCLKADNVPEAFDAPRCIVWSFWANVDARLKWEDGDLFFNGEVFMDGKVNSYFYNIVEISVVAAYSNYLLQ